MTLMKENDYQELLKKNEMFRVLVARDGKESAIDTVFDLIDQSDYDDFDIEEFLYDECGLEPDYIFDVVAILEEYTGRTVI